MTIAVYAGSFDPVTNGHLDIATRSAKLFDKVIVAVYDIPAKSLLFNTAERVALFKKAVAGIPNIKVQPYSELTVDFVRKVGGQVMVRGLRVDADFQREFEMGMLNKKLAPDLELVCFMTNQKYQFVSSSLLKEIAQLGGDIADLVSAGENLCFLHVQDQNVDPLTNRGNEVPGYQVVGAGIEPDLATMLVTFPHCPGNTIRTRL